LTRVLKSESACVSGKAKACNELGSIAYECKAVLASAQIKRPEGNCSVELIDSGEIHYRTQLSIQVKLYRFKA
jgi:hypothetical protein